MQMTEVDEMHPWRLTLNEDLPLTEGIAPSGIEQPRIDIGPVFCPASEGVQVEATWEGTDWPALVTKTSNDWTSVYSATPLLSPELVKRIARRAGVAVRVDGTEPSFVTRNLVCVHAAVDRTETLHFPEPMRVVDLVTGEILAAAATDLEVAVPGPGTRLLQTIPAQ